MAREEKGEKEEMEGETGGKEKRSKCRVTRKEQQVKGRDESIACLCGEGSVYPSPFL